MPEIILEEDKNIDKRKEKIGEIEKNAERMRNHTIQGEEKGAYQQEGGIKDKKTQNKEKNAFLIEGLRQGQGKKGKRKDENGDILRRITDHREIKRKRFHKIHIYSYRRFIGKRQQATRNRSTLSKSSCFVLTTG
ncbi:MAG TPA: hypothetical protein IAC60_02380 [Candidatus Enterosoma merdigallinarum]|nr:hypothetical protein [Candidatus Enterosoma merdigallinarum]